MKGSELVAEARRLLRDTATPYLWEDPALLSYLNVCEQEFARLTHVLQDFTNYSITTSIGVCAYELDPKIISVLMAQVDGETQPLRRNTSLLQYRFTSVQSTLRLYATAGANPSIISFYPAPDAVYTVNLGVAILPAADIEEQTEPSIAAEYHMDLPFGVAARALLHSDTDGFAPEQLQLMQGKWDMALRNAKRDAYRRSLSAANTVAVSGRGTP